MFVGIPIEEKLAKQILNWVDIKLEGFPIRKISKDNLHVTLIPPWYEENINKVIEKLELPKIKAFHFQFDSVSFGPNPRNPRLVWATGEFPQEISELTKILSKSLQKIPERRDYLLHLTIARFKPRDFGRFKIKNLDEKVMWRQKVDRICLYESKLQRGGAVYTNLKTMKLG